MCASYHIGDYAKQFLTHCRLAKSLLPASLMAYKQDLQEMLGFFGNSLCLTQIDKIALQGYIQFLNEERLLKPSSIKRRIATCKNFFHWCRRCGLIEHSPFDGADITIKLPKKLPRYIGEEDVAKLLQGWKNIYDYINQPNFSTANQTLTSQLSMAMMLATGIRIGELVRLKLEDVSQDGVDLRIFGKGAKERKVYIAHHGLAMAVKLYRLARLKESSPQAALLVNAKGKVLNAQTLRIRLRKLGELTGFQERLTPHRLRHTAATRLIESGTDIRFVQRLLGHSSISTTQIYTHVTDKSLRTALQTAQHMHPLLPSNDYG